MIQSRDLLGKNKQSSFRAGRINKRDHFMMPELGTIIGVSGEYLHTQTHQIGARKAFRNRLAMRASRAINQIRGRGKEVEAIDVIIETSRTDGHLIILMFGDLNGGVRRHFRVADKRAQKMDQSVIGGNPEVRTTSRKSQRRGILSSIGRVGRELPELRIYMDDMTTIQFAIDGRAMKPKLP